MKKFIIIFGLICFSAIAGCAPKAQISASPAVSIPAHETTIAQIDSFQPETACLQAVQVINSNPYTQDHFERVFAKVVAQVQESSSETNAGIIWDHFVVPLKKSGKVPPDQAVYMWNCYFSKQFVSLPNDASVDQQCYRLPEIKNNLEKEYQLKRVGFQASRQGDADTHFVNAMYVYNTMWAACHPQSK